MIYFIPFLIGLLVALLVLYLLAKTVVNFTIKKINFMAREEAIAVVQGMQQNPASADDIPALEKFPIKIGDKIIFVELEAVAYIEAKENYVFIHDLEGNEYLTDITLKLIEQKAPAGFVRIHRSQIVNTMAIREIHKYLNGKFAFVLKDKKSSKIISSLSYSENVRKLFKV